MTSADGEVLLLHVPASAAPPDGFWQPLTGGIEPSEQPVDAAVREVREETGVKVEPTEFRFVADGIRVQITPDFEVVKTLFVVELPSREITVSPEEHDDHRWVAQGQVEQLLHWPSNRETWDQVRRFL
jgi:8-oxo-dGTP pyrophosphatase MutT (NUDIX family)